MTPVCSQCGAARDDPARAYFPLWFVQTETRKPLCPLCAANLAGPLDRESNIRAMGGVQAQRIQDSQPDD